MKIHFDRDKCQGHGRCYALAPTVFDTDDEGYAVLKLTGEVPDALADSARIAVDNCPEYALSLES